MQDAENLIRKNPSNPKSRSPKPKTNWRKTYQMDLESKLNECGSEELPTLKEK